MAHPGKAHLRISRSTPDGERFAEKCLTVQQQNWPQLPVVNILLPQTLTFESAATATFEPTSRDTAANDPVCTRTIGSRKSSPWLPAVRECIPNLLTVDGHCGSGIADE
jgi:hypothetical protein